MLKSTELKKTVDAIKAKIVALQANEQWDDAAKEAKNLEQATNELSTAIAMEAADRVTAGTTAAPAAEDAPIKRTAKMDGHIWNKRVRNMVLTPEEAKYMNAAGTPGVVESTDGKGGYVVPTEQEATLLEFRRDYAELKTFCDVRNVASAKGTVPTIGKEAGKLIAFDEGNQINKDDLDFGQLAYSIKSYGDIIPVSNEVMADASIDLMSVIGRRFALKSVNTENEAIIAALPSKQTAITDYKGIVKALNITLDPAISATAAIFLNQDGYDYLDELTDAQGCPMLTASLADPQVMLFKGRPVHILSNDLLPTKTGAMPIYVGSMPNAVAFFDRQLVTVAASAEAGFTSNQTLIRAIERFDVRAEDSEAMVCLSLKLSST